jgi:hypothetical protein
MAITFIDAGIELTSFSSSGVTFDMSTVTHAAGDVLVATPQCSSSGRTFAVSGATGWVKVDEDADYTNRTEALFYKVATSSSEADPTFDTGTSHEFGVIVAVFRGVGGDIMDVDVLLNSTHKATGTGSTPTPKPITTETANTVVLVAYASKDVSTFTGPSGYSTAETGSVVNVSAGLWYKAVAAAGVETPGDLSVPGGDNFIVLTFALSETPGDFDRAGSLTDALADTISADVPIGVIATIPTPTITTTSTPPVLPDTLGVIATIPLPTISTATVLSPAATGVSVTIPTPLITTVDAGAGDLIVIYARDVSRFYRLTDSEGDIELVLPLGVGRGGLHGYSQTEFEEEVSSKFVLNGTPEGHAVAMAAVATAWDTHKNSSAAALTAAINANLNIAGFRDKNGNLL